jgi:Uma2 family endonuclease
MSSVRHDVHDEQWLRQRSAAGLDKFDEVWNGVLHVVPPPSGPHQLLSTFLAFAMHDCARSRGLLFSMETGVFDPVLGMHDYRTPDFSVYRPENASERGIDGRAELVVEVRSPRDETYEKFPFYAAQHVQEILVVHPDSRRFELYRLNGADYVVTEADASGVVTVASLDVALETVATDDGPRLAVTVGDITTHV